MDLDFIKLYLKIDGNDEDEYIQDLLEVSEIYIDAMVGVFYKSYPDAVKLGSLLQRKLIHDMHEIRGTEIPSGTKTDRVVVSILDKLSNYEEVLI